MAEVEATTPTITTLDVGDEWSLGVCVPSGSAVAVSVTAPDGAVASVDPEAADGGFTALVPILQAGRYLAVVTVTGDVSAVVPFTAQAATPTAQAGMPDSDEVKNYLSTNGGTSATDAAIQEALDAEAEAQRRACNVPAVYPPDLREALKRRVARNLAARSVPIAQITSFEGGATASRVPQKDPEVARLEGPHRKVVIA